MVHLHASGLTMHQRKEALTHKRLFTPERLRQSCGKCIKQVMNAADCMQRTCAVPSLAIWQHRTSKCPHTWECHDSQTQPSAPTNA